MSTTISIQFDGLCCHAVTASGRRALVVDATAHAHETYIEVDPSDFDDAANLAWAFTPVYARNGRLFRRAAVRDVKIEIVNAIVSSSFTVSGLFNQRIPKLSLVEPSFTSIHSDFLQPTIATNKVAAYFDMSGGFLSSGPPEAFETQFVPAKSWPQRKLGEYTELQVDIDTSVPPTFRVTDLASGVARDLVLEPAASQISIGNQLLDDILGIPPAPGRMPHFSAYYDLAGSPLADRPEPKPGLGLDIGCSNSSYP